MPIRINRGTAQPPTKKDDAPDAVLLLNSDDQIGFLVNDTWVHFCESPNGVVTVDTDEPNDDTCYTPAFDAEIVISGTAPTPEKQ